MTLPYSPGPQPPGPAGPAGPGSWRPDLRWVAAGPVIGLVVGALAGAVLLLATSDEYGPVMDVVVGAFIGGIFGAPVGIGTGVAQALLVGRGLDRRTTQTRATVVGGIVTPALLVASVTLATWEPASIAKNIATVVTELWWLLLCVAASAALVSWWFAGLLAKRRL